MRSCLYVQPIATTCPSSSLGGTFASAGKTAVVSKGGDTWESFKGKGETLGGRKTKGKGVSHRKIEDVSDGSKIIRTECVFALISACIILTTYTLQ